jgi:hypothetical protein
VTARLLLFRTQFFLSKFILLFLQAFGGGRFFTETQGFTRDGGMTPKPKKTTMAMSPLLFFPFPLCFISSFQRTGKLDFAAW